MRRALAIALVALPSLALAQTPDAPPPGYAPPPPGYAPPPPGYAPPPPGYEWAPAPPPQGNAMPLQRPRVKFAGQVGIGGGFSWEFAEPLGGFIFDARLGLEIPGVNFRFGMRLLGDIGRTQGGLNYGRFQVGPNFMFNIGSRFQAGFTLHFGSLSVPRARTDIVYSAFVLGFTADANVDLVKTKDAGALILWASLGLSWEALIGHNSAVPLVRGGLGWRF